VDADAGKPCIPLQYQIANPNLRQRMACSLKILFDLPNQFSHLEWFALDLREADRIDQKLRADEHGELSEIQFGNDHRFKTLQDIAQVRWKRIEMTQMRARHRISLLLQLLDRGRDRSVGRSPSQDQDFAFLRTVDFERRNVLLHALNLFGT